MHIQPTMPAMVTGGGGFGDGFGGGGLLALALLAGRGGFGFGNDGFRRDGEGCVTPANLTAGLTGVTDAIQNTEVMASLGDIKAAVPLAESQTQLAIQGAQSDITSQTQAQTLNLSSQLFNGQLSNLAGFANTKDAVDSLSTQVAIGQGVTNTNIERLGWQLSRENCENTNKILSQMNAIEQSNLNRIITTQAAELAELRNESARANDRHGIEITMNNNQAQAQLQAQAQQQQIANLTACLHGVSQLAQATNQQLIIGNTGVASGGNQTSNPVNVRA